MILNSRKGFTLVEILIAVAVVAVVSGSSLSYLDTYTTYRSVDLTVKELEAVVFDVKRRSIAQQDGEQWGIHFVHSSSTEYYDVFSGSSYASGTVVSRVPLSSKLTFGTPVPSSTLTALFEPVTGDVPETITITIVPKRGQPYVGVITISAFGRVSREVYDKMVGYFKFEEGVGSTTRDLIGSVGVYDTSDDIPGDIIWASSTSCKSGSCVLLNGAYFIQGDFAQAQSFSKLAVTAWVKLTQNGNYGSVLTGLEGTKEWFDARFQASARKPEFRTYSGEELTYNSAINVGTWYHIAYVYDGARKYIYLNGVDVASTSKTGLEFTLNEFDIGRSEEKDNYLLEGYLDELKLFNKALTPAEVREDYNLLK